MRKTCQEYQRLTRAYQRAFTAWSAPKNVHPDRATDADLEALEKKYRVLTDHQQSCPVCLAELAQTAGLR